MLVFWAGVPAVLGQEQEKAASGLLPLDAEITWLTDSAKVYDAEHIRQVEDGWQPYTTDLSFLPKRVYWLKIHLQEALPPVIEDYLFAFGLNIDEATLALPNGRTLKSGRLIPLPEQTVFTPRSRAMFRFPGESYKAGSVFYVRLEERSGMKPEVGIALHDYIEWKRAQEPERVQRYLLQAAFQGTIWIMVLYNMAIFLIYLDRVYLYYASYMAAVSLFVAQTYGLLIEFVIGHAPEFDLLMRAVGIHLAGACYLMFMLSFLDLRQIAPRIHKVIRFLVVGIMVNLVLSISIIYFLENVKLYRVSSSLVFGLIYLTVIASVLFLWRRYPKNTLLKYFFGGTIAIMGAGVIAVVLYFTSDGYVNIGFWAQNGVVIEIIFFSLGLGYRMKLQERERRRIEAENARILREQNQTLEERVRERTQELRLKNEEVLTQNEELHQQQEEIIAQRDYIEEQNGELKEQNRRITDSLRYAQTIQDAILPTDESLRSCFSDHFAMYYPKDIVSGDFYWHEQAGGYHFIAVVDCTGHGVPGAFMSMMGSILLNEIVLEEQCYEPAKILEELDHLVRYSLNQGSGSNRDGMDLSICRLKHHEEGGTTLTYAGAKRPLFYFDWQSHTLKKVKGTRRSIGGRLRHQRPFEQQQFDLHKGTRLYLFTDGYPDQHNLRGVKLGSLRLEQLLEQIAPNDLQEQGLTLHEKLRKHQGTQEQRDDITFLGLEL